MAKKKTRKTSKGKAARRRFESKISYRLREIPIKQIKVWDEAEARKLDREGLSELAKSIKNEGLQNPPMLQKEGKNSYLLMSGQRRLAALKRLRAKKIPALVLTRQSAHEIEDAKAVSMVENLHRNKMDLKDTAASCKFLAERIGKAKAAKSLGLSMFTFKKYLGFAGVPDKLKEIVPKMISRDEATKLYQVIPNVPKAVKIAQRISKLDASTRRGYLAALSKSPRATHRTLLKRARLISIKQNISFKLSKTQARKLATQARRYDLQQNEFASEIVSKWLKRKRF